MSREDPRPSDRSARKHDAILSAARTVFLREGFAGASMDVVASESGVSKQTIYAHFGSKEALFTASVADLTERIAHDLPTPPAPGLDPAGVEAWLTEYAVRQVRGVLVPDVVRLRRLVIAEAERFPGIAQAFHDNGVRRSVAILTAAVRVFVADGILAADDPATAARDFNWLVMGEPVNQAMLSAASTAPTGRRLRTHARHAAAVFLAAYRPDR